MTRVSLVITDVDGTLVRSDKSLSDATIAAARRLREAGVAMTLISARPPSGVLPLAHKLGIENPVACFNGGTLVAPDGTIQLAHRLSAEASRAAVAIFEAKGVTIWVYADGHWYTSNPHNPHNVRELRAAMVEPIIGQGFNALHGRIDKIVAVSDELSLIRELEQETRQAVGDGAAVSRSQDYFCDVTHSLANKGDGVEALARTIGVSLEATVAIGDMRNDIAMFGRVGIAIAMGQAPETVRQAARWSTSSNDDDGVAQAIDRILGKLVRNTPVASFATRTGPERLPSA